MPDESWARITRQCLDPGGAVVIALDNSELHDVRLVASLREAGCFVVALDEEQPIASEQELMDQLGRACGFEWYSQNWDALLDWLSDWTWMRPYPSYVLILHHPLALANDVRHTFFEVVRDAANRMRAYSPQALKLLVAKTPDPQSAKSHQQLSS